MASKSRYVGVKLEPEQVRKLIVLSLVAGEPGNMSAALRWLVDTATVPAVVNPAELGPWAPLAQEEPNATIR